MTSLPVEPSRLSEVACNVIVHYRASGHTLPETTRSDVNLRWIDRLLATDQSRHNTALDDPREATTRAQGCCRDHTLFCVSALRAHGLPARSRVGFAGYFVDGWHHDHVIVQTWNGSRWCLFDPELATPVTGVPDPMDMAWEPATGHGFTSAARAWLAFRHGKWIPRPSASTPLLPPSFEAHASSSTR